MECMQIIVTDKDNAFNLRTAEVDRRDGPGEMMANQLQKKKGDGGQNQSVGLMPPNQQMQSQKDESSTKGQCAENDVGDYRTGCIDAGAAKRNGKPLQKGTGQDFKKEEVLKEKKEGAGDQSFGNGAGYIDENIL